MRVLRSAVTGLVTVGAVAVGLVSGASAHPAPAAHLPDTGAVRAPAEGLLLYRADNAETIANIQVAGCIGVFDPGSNTVPLIADALKEGEQPPDGNCLTTPAPPVPTSRTDSGRADHDPGPQTIPDVKVSDLDTAELQVCRTDTAHTRTQGQFDMVLCMMGHIYRCSPGRSNDVCSARVKLNLPDVT